MGPRERVYLDARRVTAFHRVCVCVGGSSRNGCNLENNNKDGSTVVVVAALVGQVARLRSCFERSVVRLAAHFDGVGRKVNTTRPGINLNRAGVERMKRTRRRRRRRQ